MSKQSNAVKKAIEAVVEIGEAVELTPKEPVGRKGVRKYDEKAVRAEAERLTEGIAGVSARIRKLDSLGWERGKIAVGLDKRYQHVRNVLTQPVKS